MRHDGLPPWEQAPSTANSAAVQRLIEQGVFFMPISGRMIANMSPLVAGIGEPAASTPLTLISGYNGGLVVQQDGRPSDKQWQETKHIVLSRSAIESATSFVAENGLLMKIYFRNSAGSCCMASCGDFDYSVEQAEFFYGCGEFPYTAADAGSSMLEPAHRALLHTAPFPITRVPYDVDTIFALNPMKLVILTNTPDETMAAAAAKLPAGEADLIRGNFWYEYMPPGVNKSTTLAWVAEQLGFTIDECVAFGDSSNDFEMLRDAGLGVATSNARPEVKDVSKYTSAFTNEEDAVGKEINNLLAAGAFATAK